jgi:predicted enzyme related to lactoylglutathione lyase
MSTKFFSLLFDATDHRAVARFWSQALGRTLAFSDDDGAVVAPGPVKDSLFVFLPVPEPKTVKNRIHVDLASESETHQRELVERLIGLGARPVDVGQRDAPWVVLADPEGNEFCVLEPRPTHGYSGPVASIVIDAADPSRMADFWSAVTGWPVVRTEGWGTVLQAASDDGVFLELVRNDDPKTVKNRVHIDVAPTAGDDQAAEVERLVGLGARRVDIGQGDAPWVVLADPEGNEFCVLTPR